MRPTAIARILHAAIDETPGAVGGSLAAPDGETVDAVAPDREDLAFLTAHYAVVVHQVRAALGVFHYGEVIEVVVLNHRVSVLVRMVTDGYLALLALAPESKLAIARRALGRAADRLRLEIA